MRALAAAALLALGVPLHLVVAPGLLGAGTALVGPAQERYAGAPWPSGSFTPD